MVAIGYAENDRFTDLVDQLIQLNECDRMARFIVLANELEIRLLVSDYKPVRADRLCTQLRSAKRSIPHGPGAVNWHLLMLGRMLDPKDDRFHVSHKPAKHSSNYHFKFHEIVFEVGSLLFSFRYSK